MTRNICGRKKGEMRRSTVERVFHAVDGVSDVVKGEGNAVQSHHLGPLPLFCGNPAGNKPLFLEGKHPDL
jgi:hypothetical protein